jgi:hypothetical protein
MIVVPTPLTYPPDTLVLEKVRNYLKERISPEIGYLLSIYLSKGEYVGRLSIDHLIIVFMLTLFL